MIHPHFALAAVLALTLASSADAQPGKPHPLAPGNAPADVVKPAEGGATPSASKTAPDAAPATARGRSSDGVVAAMSKMPLPGMAPAKLFPDLCLLRYKVTTHSDASQEYFDQGLGYWYSYVWMEAARSFETALQYDPDCAMAWWGLYRALDRQGKRDLATRALLKANELKDRASWREQQLIWASMQATGNAPGVGDAEARKRAAVTTIDNLIAVHDEDEEAWYFRAQLAGGSSLFGGQVASVPFYKALLRINPLHPGANHELVHYYENARRPALGWVYAENYIKSSPGIPHPFHMQAHLATRIGRWARTSDRSARAIELERNYHKEQGVSPREDQQYSHHLEILLVSLTHDGRFKEASAIEDEARTIGARPQLPAFRLHLAAREYDAALKIANEYRRNDKNMASYLTALVYLKKGDCSRALPEIEVLQHALANRKNDKQLEYRLWETQGLYLCQTGAAEQGVKLLQKAVARSKDDYGHHAWGNGAYYMEAWGLGALRGGKDAAAEEAYLEALAHDPGSVRAALGLQVLCERQGRPQEAQRYAELARKCWAKADSGCLARELQELRAPVSKPEGPPEKPVGPAR